MNIPPKPRNPFQKLPSTISPGNFSNNFETLPFESQILLDQNSKTTTEKSFSRGFQKPSVILPNQIEKVLENPLAQMGYEYSKNQIQNIISTSQNSYFQFFGEKARVYFDIDQEVIFKKILFVIFPFRIESSTDSEQETLCNTYRPELYLPLMSLVTFVMISCLRLIFSGGKILPGSIVHEVFQCFLFTFFECLLGKIAIFFGASLSVPYFDIVSFCGYKYVV